jgi:transposase InsO family protein
VQRPVAGRQAAITRLGALDLTTRPYRPRTNGKAERFIQTALREWLYGKPSARAERATGHAGLAALVQSPPTPRRHPCRNP